MTYCFEGLKTQRNVLYREVYEVLFRKGVA